MQPPTATLDVRVNDEHVPVPAGTGLSALLDRLGLGGRPGLAVAVNATVVPRAGWASRLLEAGDQVLIIQASQGG